MCNTISDIINELHPASCGKNGHVCPTGLHVFELKSYRVEYTIGNSSTLTTTCLTEETDPSVVRREFQKMIAIRVTGRSADAARVRIVDAKRIDY